MYGLAYAINTFQKPTEKLEDTFKNTEKKEIEAGKETKSQSFKSWASWCIRNKILDDINNLSRTVRVDAYHQGLLKKTGEDIPISHSIEALGSDKDGEDGGMMDRIMQLSTSDDRAGEGEESQKWNILFKSLEKKLPKRDVSIFYKLFGLNGEQVTKGKDIAAEFGISQAAVTTAKNKVLSFLQNNKDLRDILLDILNIYTESLMSKVWNKSQEDILEALRNDNTYILLEELNRWSNPKVLESAINTVLYKSSDFTKEDTIFITDCLTAEDERFITENFKKQRRVLVTFLESMYPQETFARKSDGYICEKMEEFRKLIEEYKIVL
jgi:RNA polymerase sigma factor (sigma-70 family)